MSQVPSSDTSPDFPTSSDEDRNQGENDLQTTAASPSTLSGIQTNITPTSNTSVQHSGSSENVPTVPSPSVDRRRHYPSPKEDQAGVAPVDFAPDGFSESQIFGGSSSSAGYASNSQRRLAEAQQQQPVEPTLTDVTNTSTPGGGSPRAISPAGWLKSECEKMRKKQEELQINIDGPSRIPERADFPPALYMKIISPVEPIESCIILMHDLANNEASFEACVQNLQRKQPESAFILLRGLQPIGPGRKRYHWADTNGTVDEGFINTTKVILKDIIQDGLMAKCGFQPRDVVILGHGQGGMAALATTACWNNIEFGGVVSFGGPMPGYVQLPFNTKAKTPALIYGDDRGDITPAALQQIEENYSFTDHHTPSSGHGTLPSDKEMAPLLAFLAHRLRREEWKRQAVISFDGGGVRGYGSLLILQDLMNKIGDLEKTSDKSTKSSFSPCDYKPTTVEPANTDSGSATSLPSDLSEQSEAGTVGPTKLHGLPNSALFLPCHYFTYAAGSSTGGLISIMLSRFRMTVDDCIEEYKTLGKKIFGHPRPMTIGGLPWSRFNASVLEDVIRDVTSRHNKRSDDFGNHYGMERGDEDMCQCLVLAYADHIRGESPYLFRTYENKAPRRQQSFKNPGGASMLPIWQVARATSAAPGYFRPIRIETDRGSEAITFKDGGFGSNNPSEEAYKDILNKHGGIMNMGPFISIGTGQTPLNMFSKKSDHLSDFIANVKTTLKLPSRTFNAHENMLHHAYPPNSEVQFPYYRFDGGTKLGEVDLGDWESHRLTGLSKRDATPGRKTLEKIETAINDYLKDRRVQRDLMRCAKLLVDRRRLRTRNASDWDRYASYSHYDCDVKGCPKRSANTAHDFKEHLRRHHKYQLADPVLEKKIRECRRVQWLYRSQDTGQEETARKKGKGRA